jgi:fructose-1,6-bisphosphatase/inositol monophosphatase family enzyme
VARAESLLEPLLALHERVRDAVVDACTRRSTEHLAAVASDGAQDGDTIYAVDRVAEETLAQGLADLAREEPLCVVGEGLGDSLGEDGRWRLLVDPIDGTRGLMYQKRSAWILTGVAPNRGPSTRLRDIVLAVQTEIPLVKQHLSDQLWAIGGQGMEARRCNRLSGARERLTLRPSHADTIAHGFASVVRFFPGARALLAAIDDEVMQSLVTPAPGRAACFEDQYASTGGQLYELMAGHDRFIADLRALVSAGLCCHPYDLSAALIAQAAGVILTDPAGAPLDAPFDLTTDVSWIGYANERLRVLIEPVLRNALRRRGLLGP